MQRRDVVKMIGLGGLTSISPISYAENSYPERPIVIVTPFSAGNTVEVSWREMGQIFHENTGQPLVIESKPGGAGSVGAMYVKNAKPDGYTLFSAGNTPWTVNPHTFPNLSYDPDTDFEPITLVLTASMVMAVNSAIPVDTFEEFVDWVKEHPKEVRFASFSAGNTSHFVGVLLNERAGIDMLHVPYKGTPEAVTALLSGVVDVTFVPMMAIKPHVDAGKVKVLATTAPKRSPHMPDVPTFVELGYPDLDIVIWAGLVAPKGTPSGVIAYMNKEITKVLRTDKIKELWYPRDFTPMPTTPEEFRAFYQAESKRWAEAVKISGFRQGS